MTACEPQIIGTSQAILKVREIILKVADVDLNVLISGESGVGKELVARALHYYSGRREKPFMKVNCAALPGELMETELFGYEKGAFTGADRRRIGKFEAAADGSIFLDEIGEIPLTMQAKLLQVLQDQKFPRIGGNKEIGTQARVIAATNRNLEAEILAGNFREDLYFRINTISIVVPPLRERKEDIPPLVDFFLEQHRAIYGNTVSPVPASLMELFLVYHWPGNVRELGNYLKRLSVLGNHPEIERELRCQMDISAARQTAPGKDGAGDPVQDVEAEPLVAVPKGKKFPSLKEIRDQAVMKVEKAVIEQVLEETKWNRREAARILKISYRTLLYKLKDMNIRRMD